MINVKSQNNSLNKIDLANKKAWLIIDSAGNIKYNNEIFTKIFNLKKNDNLKSLNFLPNLYHVIKKLSENEIIEFNNSFIYEVENQIINFLVEIETVNLFNSIYFIIVFNAQEEERYIEDKISNLHYALEYGKIPVILFNNDGIISFATNSCEKIFNFELDKIYNNHISVLLSKYIPDSKFETLLNSVEHGKEWTDTISIKEEKGEQFFLELNLNPILNDEGNLFNFVLTVHDITDYILKNELTEKSEQQLKSIINNISDLLIILKEANGSFYFENGNDNFLRQFNINKEDAYQKIHKEVLPELLADKIEESIFKLNSTIKNHSEFEYPDGEKYYSGKITSIKKSIEKEALYIINLKDISADIKKKEQLNELYKKEMQLNRLKTTFLQNMSHEIRTPFTAIMGYSDIMVESIEEEDYETVVEITDSLKNVLNRVMNLFENILEVSEIESDDVELELVAINCNQILRAVYNKKFEEVKSKNLAMKIDLDDDNYLCLVDWGKFEKIILNLVENAIKYTDNGEVKITSKKMDNHVVITISDTGLGINPKIVSQLLEPFVQEELDGHSRNYEGAGLGLTIASKYTKLMNGEMSVKSKKNIGTKISLNFPIKQE